MLITNTSSESACLISSKLIGFGNPFHIECLKGGAAVVRCAGMNAGNMIQDEKTELEHLSRHQMEDFCRLFYRFKENHEVCFPPVRCRNP